MSQGLWAVTDQGLFALSNFTVTVLLARWLLPSDFGAFAVAFSVLLLLGTIHNALLTEPMLVLGPSRFRDRTAGYVRRLSSLNIGLTSVMGVALLLVVAALTVLMRPLGPATTLAALAVSAPAILFLWLMRRACYLESRPRLAAGSALIYALVVPAGILLLRQLGLLTAASGLMIMGVSGLVVALWLLHRLTRTGEEPISTVPRSEVMHAHWNYGRWALGSALLSWVPSNAVVLALPWWYSLDDAGALRVATTLMLPVLHLQGALGPLFMPALVRARLSGHLRSTPIEVGSILLALGVAYAPLVLIFGSWFAGLLFGPEYPIDGTTLWLLAAIPVVSAISAISGAVLRAVERPDRVLWTYVAATAVTCLVGLPLVFAFGVDGALASLLLSSATTALLGTLASRQYMAAPRQPSGARAGPDAWPAEPQSDAARAWEGPAS